MDLLAQFHKTVSEAELFSATDELILAVSGGVDSVVLTALCKKAGYSFSIAHCNFQLRGEESDRDEQFVKELAASNDATYFIERFETTQYAATYKLSIQEAARELRYNWFEKLVSNVPVKNGQRVFLLTAHHADDNVETLLMNFFRGTGLHGLTGIPQANEYIRRPLLNIAKTDLLEFAKREGLSFVEDSSNDSNKYTRNFFRNELIPSIGKVYPQVNQNLQNNIRRFTEIDKLYQHGVTTIKKKLCKQKGREIHIPVKQLMQFNNRALIYEIISSYGFSEKQVDEVIKLASGDTGKYIQSPSGEYRFIRNRHWFIISPVNAIEADNIIITEEDSNVLFAAGSLFIGKIKADKSPVPGNNNNIALLDLRNISFPLILRRTRAGDYFYPLGMKKKKKISRFFIDLKLSKTEKESAWVIESSKRIIWVAGYRIDDRFKLIPSSREILQLNLTKES